MASFDKMYRLVLICMFLMLSQLVYKILGLCLHCVQVAVCIRALIEENTHRGNPRDR